MAENLAGLEASLMWNAERDIRLFGMGRLGAKL
jgi:hypothetical protein